jgi:hypothetical protein
MTRLRLLLLASALLATLPGCGQPDANTASTQASSPRTQLPAYGRFVATYEAAQHPALKRLYRQAREERWLDETVTSLNQQFRLPRDVEVKTAECGENNAFFDPEAHSITLCYELVAQLQQQARAQQLPPAEQEAYLEGVLSFVFLHELGHALIHELALPATGREEDAADQLAVVSLLGDPDNDSEQVFAHSVAQIGHVATWFQLNASGQYEMAALADSHALDEQRFYNVMCWLYGARPEAFDDMIRDGQLPAERAEGCPDEYQQINHSWDTLLAPHRLPSAR